jgi:hypothetical protein
VLITGYDDETISDGGAGRLYCNDPGFSNQYYAMDEIVGWRIFTMEL